MILFRCFPEIPVYDPQSDNAWVNRARYDTDEVLAQAVRGERPFTQYCCRVVEDLTHLKYYRKEGCFRNASGTNRFTLQELPQQREPVREAAALVMVKEELGPAIFDLNDVLAAPPVLRALHALPHLPYQINFAVTYDTYASLAYAVDNYYHRSIEYETRCAYEDAADCPWDNGVYEVETDASRELYRRRLRRFDFIVMANGRFFHVCQEHKGPDSYGFVNTTKVRGLIRDDMKFCPKSLGE